MNDKKLIDEIYKKDASKCTNEEIELSILIPFYYILSNDEKIDVLKINNGYELTREEFNKTFNKILKKIKDSPTN